MRTCRGGLVTESIAQRCLALIKANGSMRSSQIAEALGVAGKAIGPALAPYCVDGTLISCKVIVNGTAETEYRESAGGMVANKWRVLDHQRTPPHLPRPWEGPDIVTVPLRKPLPEEIKFVPAPKPAKQVKTPKSRPPKGAPVVSKAPRHPVGRPRKKLKPSARIKALILLIDKTMGVA